MKKITLLFSLLLITLSITNTKAGDDKANSLIKSLEEAVGTWDKLYAKKNVQFTYEYLYPGAGIKDLSTEKYIFEGEHSYAMYSVHQINVAKDAGGVAYQCYDGKNAMLKLDDKAISDPKQVGATEFLRKANYFWFVMNFKFSNPGVIATYKGTEEVNGVAYDKVSITYESNKTGKEQNDEYILYLNPETHLVDQFYFSLPFMGVGKPVLKMEVEYSTIEGIALPTKRKIYMPGEDGKLATSPNLVQTSSDVSFNNDFTASDLKL